MLAQELEPEEPRRTQGRKPLVGEAQACFSRRAGPCFGETRARTGELAMLARMCTQFLSAGSAFFLPPHKGAAQALQV